MRDCPVPQRGGEVRVPLAGCPAWAGTGRLHSAISANNVAPHAALPHWQNSISLSPIATCSTRPHPSPSPRTSATTHCTSCSSSCSSSGGAASWPGISPLSFTPWYLRAAGGASVRAMGGTNLMRLVPSQAFHVAQQVARCQESGHPPPPPRSFAITHRLFPSAKHRLMRLLPKSNKSMP